VNDKAGKKGTQQREDGKIDKSETDSRKTETTRNNNFLHLCFRIVKKHTGKKALIMMLCGIEKESRLFGGQKRERETTTIKTGNFDTI
jgi:hypothetical protein